MSARGGGLSPRGYFTTGVRRPPPATTVMRSSSLHFHLGVVDEILQRVDAGVVVAELSVVGDYSCGGVVGAHHTADVHRLDVREVSEDPCSGCAGGLTVISLITHREPYQRGGASFFSEFNLYSP